MSYRHFHNVRGFFSDYFLGSVFGRGEGKGRRHELSDKGTDAAYRRFQRLRERVLSLSSRPDETATREKYLRPLLFDILGFHLGPGENHVHALFASASDEVQGRPPLVLAYVGEWDGDLDAGRGGQNPPKRLLQALAKRGLPYGFLLTGEKARLMRAEGDGPSGAYLEADLEALDEDEDRESFALFLKIFHSAEFIPGPEGRPIAAVEREAQKYAQKVGDELKSAVFNAAESLVRGLVKDGSALRQAASSLGAASFDPARPPEPVLRLCRDAALLGLYRMLFILYAEARDSRLREHAIYQNAYSMEALVEELLQDRGPSAANSHCLWERLKATFRVYDKGLPKIKSFENIPPRGGDFFSGETPEGRVLAAADLPDTLARDVVLGLATLPGRKGVGRERIAFNELDIENLGRVYEGLLEHEPRIADQPILEVKASGRLLALTTEDLRRLCVENEIKLKGDAALLAGTGLEVLHGDSESLEEEDDAGFGVDESGEEGVEEDEKEEKLKKGSALDVSRRLEPGDFYFMPGGGRKGSGSFYTPIELVQDLIQHALLPKASGRSPEEIEALRLLDPSCGSGHFLVEAMRVLGHELHRAYFKQYKGQCPPAFRDPQKWKSGNPEASDLDARKSGDEARAWCKRRVAERCLFGVDLNPMAVQLARVALWIESLAGDRPLTFFQHHIRVGNSLLGSQLENLEKPPLKAMAGSRAGDLFSQMEGLFMRKVREQVAEAARLRLVIDAAGGEEDIRELEFKQAQARKAEETLASARLLFDLRSASAFVVGQRDGKTTRPIWDQWETLCSMVEKPGALEAHARKQAWWMEFEGVRGRERFFHWELEYPELFLEREGGFDVVLGNPPWEKVKPDKKEFYAQEDVLIRAFVGGELDARIRELQKTNPGLKASFEAYEARLKTLAACMKQGGGFEYQDWEINGKSTGGDLDLFRFFAERCHQVLRPEGRAGLVLPSAVYNNEGATGLRHLLLNKSGIERFYGFENRTKVFPIDSRFKFISLCFSKSSPKPEGFQAAFMRHDLEELKWPSEKTKEWTVWIKKPELEKLSPGTLAFLEFREARDQEIIRRMYGNRPLLGEAGVGTWNAKFYREYDMTNDKDLWSQPNGKLYSVKQVLGEEPDDFEETRARMAKKGFWPLYEGKHIDQFLIDTKLLERWVNLETAEKTKRKPDPGPKLVFRDIASNTNERTCIAAVLPEGSCFGNTLAGIKVQQSPDAVATVLNSFAFDFAVRLRTAGTHLNFTYVSRLPLPEFLPSKIVRTRSAGGQARHVMDDPKNWGSLIESNLEVLEAYGLQKADLTHILKAFPLQARKRPEFWDCFGGRLGDISSSEIANIPQKPSALPFTPIPIPPAAERYKNGKVPLLTLQAAAGKFGRSQAVDWNDWVQINTKLELKKGMFVFQVVGDSMEPGISADSYCLFNNVSYKSPKKGVVVLVERNSPDDPETGGEYLVKRYHFNRRQVDGVWQNADPELRSDNPKYPPIPLEESSDARYSVKAEFLEVLKP